jgi:hypothetical protein
MAMRVWKVRSITLLVALGVTLAFAGAVTAPVAFAKSCHASGHKLYNAHGVVVFTTSDHGKYPVFICASPSGNVKRISSLSTGASVSGVQRAGHYIAFFLNTNEEVYSQYLIAFNRDRARVEVKDFAQCIGNDECPTFAQLDDFVLAPNGWVAERWANLFTPGDALLAYNGGSRHYQLEFGGVRDLSVSGNTAHWVSPIGGKSSAVLGSGVVPNPNYRSLSACQLLTAADVRPLVGPVDGLLTSNDCTYGGTGFLQVILTTGQSASEQQATISNFENASYFTPGSGWPGNLDMTDLGNDDGSTTGSQNDGFVAIYRGVALQLLYASNRDEEAALSHLTTVALERLLRVDVKRAH